MDEEEEEPYASQALADPLLALPAVKKAQDGQPERHGEELPGKYIKDEIHGTIHLNRSCVDVMDSVPFQRTRSLLQLGCANYVYPGASHSRAEHQIGTCHLAYSWARQIYKTQGKSLDMSESDVKCVALAGLCHDLGHGPLSHVFDKQFLPSVGITKWSHEDMSCRMLDLIIDQKHLDFLDTEVKLIKQLIDKGARSETWEKQERAWLFDIVANHRNSIDVDKFDYLQRDSRNCNVTVSCDFKRLMQFSMVNDNQIVFKDSEGINLRELFHSREIMHRNVYTHRKSKSVEFMAVEAMQLANEALHFTDRIHNAERFMALDDTLLKQIENYATLFPALVDEGMDCKMRDAAAIVKRIRNRDIYRFVNEVVVPPSYIVPGHWMAPPAQDIVNSYGGSVALTADDVIVYENKIDFTMTGQNPLDHVQWFHSMRDHKSPSFAKVKEQMTNMMPENFQEYTLRLYCRKRDKATVDAVNEAFENWTKKRFHSKPVELATPLKALRGGDGQAAALMLRVGCEMLPPPPPSNGPANKRRRELDYAGEPTMEHPATRHQTGGASSSS